MKNLTAILNLLQFPFLLFILIFSSTNLHAASDTYVPTEDNAILLTSLGYTDTTHVVSKNDYVYYMFELAEAGDVTITVNDIDTEED